MFAAAARFRADSAMLVLARMPLAFLAADTAGLRTCLQRGDDHLLVRPSPARSDRARSNADVGAVEIEADALPKLIDHVLGEAGVGAGCAALGAGIAFLDTADQGVIGVSPDAWMRGNHLVHMVH